MYRLNLHNCKLLLLMAILAGLRILSEVSFSSQWMLHLVEIGAIEVSSSRCKLPWITIPDRTPDGVYDLSFRYCVDPLIRVTRHTTFPLDQISNKGGDGTVRFEEMTQLNDADWKRPINPGVYLLYPQGIALREVITKYRETGLVPEPPINNPVIQFRQVSASVCPPLEGVNDGDQEYKHDLVVIVKSAVYNFEDRRKFRSFYAHLRNQSTNLPYRIGIVFSLGLPTSPRGNVFQRDGFNVTLPGRAGAALVKFGRQHSYLQARLEEEMHNQDDLIVGDFEDTYFNLTLKMHYSFMWASRFCRGGPGFLFIDDDFAFIEKNLVAALKKLPADWRRKVAIATTRWNSPTVRPSDPHFTRKWALTKGEIPWPMHAPYSNGYFSLLGYDHVADLALAMFFTKPIPIDDVWLGLVMQRINLHFSVPPGIEYSTKPGTNLSRYICVPLNSILNAPSQTQFQFVYRPNTDVTLPTKMNASFL